MSKLNEVSVLKSHPIQEKVNLKIGRILNSESKQKMKDKGFFSFLCNEKSKSISNVSSNKGNLLIEKKLFHNDSNLSGENSKSELKPGRKEDEKTNIAHHQHKTQQLGDKKSFKKKVSFRSKANNVLKGRTTCQKCLEFGFNEFENLEEFIKNNYIYQESKSIFLEIENLNLFSIG